MLLEPYGRIGSGARKPGSNQEPLGSHPKGVKLRFAAVGGHGEGLRAVQTEHFHEAVAVDRVVAVIDEYGESHGGGQGD